MFQHDQPSLLQFNTSSRKIASNGPSFLDLDFVFTFSPGVSSATIDAINLAIFELQQDLSTPYQSLVDTYFNATAAQIYNATSAERVKPYMTVIVCGALIGLYLLFIGVWALVKHGKRKNTSNNNNNKGAQSTEQEQG